MSSGSLPTVARMDAFSQLADSGFYRDVALIGGGYGAAGAADMAVDRFAGRDVPNEITGLAVVAGAQYAPVINGRQRRHVQLGAGMYSALHLAERVSVRETIEGAL